MVDKQLIIDKTPKDQSEEDRKLIIRLYQLAKKLTDINDDDFVVRHIVELDGEGQHTPDNLEILANKDFFKIKQGERTIGSITIENILGKKAMRYQGRFMKGISMKDQKVMPETKEEKKQGEEDEFAPMYVKLNELFDEKTNDYFQEAIALIGRTAHLYSSPTRAELMKWCDKFGNYYKPKLTSVEQKGSIDNQIIIKLIDDLVSEPIKVIEVDNDGDK